MAASTKTWVNNSPPQCAAEDLNGFEKENNNLITSADITLNTSDNFQTAKAVSAYAAVGDFYEDTGLANAYVLAVQNNFIAPPDYYNGMRARFFAGNDNTGAATANVGALGVKDIVDKDLSPLNGGEIFQNRITELVYDLVNDVLILMDNGTGALGIETGMSIEWNGTAASVPDGYLLENGAAISRTTFLRLFSRLQNSFVGVNITNGSPIVTGLASTLDLYVGEAVEGVGIPNGTIATIDSSTQVTLTVNATSTGTTTLNFFQWGNGNGTTTFNVPDTLCRTIIGAGAGAGLTVRPLGERAGSENIIQGGGNIAPHQHGYTRSNFALQSGNSANNSAGPGVGDATGVSGSGIPMPSMNPFAVRNRIIKI